MELRFSVPGGHVSVETLAAIVDLAQKEGVETLRFLPRQGIGLLGLDEKEAKDQEAVQAILQQLGLLYTGGLSTTACNGAPNCRFGNGVVSELAKRIHPLFESPGLIVTVSLSGCPNDCGRARPSDVGIIAGSVPRIDQEACVGCGRCITTCKEKGDALAFDAAKQLVFTEKDCIRCGKCASVCPVGAITRSTPTYTLYLGGEEVLSHIDEETLMESLERVAEQLKAAQNPKMPHFRAAPLMPAVRARFLQENYA